ncbi:MAG: phenylalanine--tRNA ligase subunit alpha [Vicingaceae bacterium]|jgi:phenylalanyl-tRNA synthetase alpha chain|nr:phenylalanine--tRNA ligase subunit alpha [Flavobacteriales bacterium]MDF1674549.1 phenylalanine--tRNA ligase subunit alpha [Vicingaceae bacterium]|tara:strand:+ start:11680 stop:12705 length:1026 start_codon:yes stop_codon:yes gene_type:complete
MKDKIHQLINEIDSFVTDSKENLEKFRIQFLGSKNVIKDLFNDFKNVPNEQKKEVGQLINEAKVKAQEKYDYILSTLSKDTSNTTDELDLTRTGYPSKIGSRHPISLVRNEIIEIFSRIGFTVSEGPEIEDDWHNFSALNFPPEHPARDMQDTFFVDAANGEMALRTHTSSVQVRVMENAKPPIRTLSPGRVYRNEAISARAHCFFHQIEGLYIDENVSFADLKQTLLHFAKEMFGEKTQIRLRPSYFPFTEPSAEMDVSCSVCNGEGCNVCKYTGFLEIMGCGMVDPNVLENCGIDSKKYSGFAFGMGIERIAMLKFKVNDLRLYSEGDIRFLSQFKSVL